MAKPVNGNNVPIIDIRQGEHEAFLLRDILEKLSSPEGLERTLPSVILYDAEGLRLFEEITYLDEYYLTNAEIEVLEKHAQQIGNMISSGSLIVELGSGNLRKIKILLDTLERHGKDVEYYALDLSLTELERTFSELPKDQYKHVQYRGLLGTYDDGLKWLKQPADRSRPLWILTLGSSLGNFDHDEAAMFLRDFAISMGPRDHMIVGLDACQNEARVFHAYNDKIGTTHRFILNGLSHLNNLMGKRVFNLADWKVVGRYNSTKNCHQAYYQAITDIVVEGLVVKAGDQIRVEESYKYSGSQRNELLKRAGLVSRAIYGNSSNDYHVHVLSASTYSFPLQPKEYAEKPVPTIDEFEHLWTVWDVVTKHMLPKEELLSKPIKLRNSCIFYLGHIPTFLDIHVSRAIGEAPTQPSSYRQIFERGIDPDVDNPEKCHAHSEIPDTWPPSDEIINFQERVRDRARSIYATDSAEKEPTSRIGRALWLGFEHEAMHLETLLYMLIQSEKILPPPGNVPDFEALAQEARSNRVGNGWIDIPSCRLSIGLDDPENESCAGRYFGWDNEKPVRKVDVPAFQAKSRPITNQEYAQYLYQTRRYELPASWALSAEARPSSPTTSKDAAGVKGGANATTNQGQKLTNDYLQGKSVRTIYGLIPLEYASDWPVSASFDELDGCAKWMNGRIPTAEEARSIYHYADRTKSKEAEKVLTRTISAVNGHLQNNGVAETPPSRLCDDGASSTEPFPDPQQFFAGLEDCNVGFKNFHPVSVTQNGSRLSGRCDMGGVWEWTSSVLERHEGFVAMDAYPGYTEDFFDGKHNIVLGGSWATHPRIAGRKSFVNWYQRNYPYVWAGARLVRGRQ